MKKRLKALEAKVALGRSGAGSESQFAALGEARSEIGGAWESESERPGYCGAQDTFYVGNMRGSAGHADQQTLAIDTRAKVAASPKL